MKKLVSLLAVTAMFFTIILSSFATEAPVNILGEQGDPATLTLSNDQSLLNEWWYWIQDGMTEDDANYSIVDGVKADGTTGKLYQAAHPTPCTGNTRIVVTMDKLKPNTKYRYSAMVKVDENVAPGGPGQGSWIAAGPASAAKGATKVAPIGAGEAGTWTEMKVDFTTPETLTKDLILYWQFEATGGTSWAYDFKLVEWYEGIDDVSSNSSTGTESTSSKDNDVDTGSTGSGMVAGVVAVAALVAISGEMVYINKKRKNSK